MAPQNPLPTKNDFDPRRGNLDAQSAWKHFGGLTIEQAKAKLHENPLYYQEDFMWMGGRAFAYYFPVIEDHLRADSEDGDYVAWILAHCIAMQFETKDILHVKHLAPVVIELAKYVIANIDRFGADEAERVRVAEAWTELTVCVETAIGK